MRVLLIEDHPIFRFGVSHLISQRWPEAHIQEAHTLQQGLTAVREHAFDLVLTDLNLPDAHGVESVSQLCRAAPDTAILVLSLHDEMAFASQVLRMGARGYLTKEHATDELIHAMERIKTGGRYLSAGLAEHMAMGVVDDTLRAPHVQLGAQEYRVLLLLAAGQRVTDIAQAMHLSPKTVSTYRTRVLEKLCLGNNVELAAYCRTHRLSSNED